MPRKRRAGWSKKRKSRSAVDPTWYTIKAILQERVVDGKLEYLIDWDNHPQTGEVYPHEWTPSDWVTEEAINEWEAKKALSAETPEPKSTAAATEPQFDSPDSQPPRPANFRQASRAQSANADQGQKRGRNEADSDESDTEPLRKKRRVVDFARSPTLESQEESVPSITSSASFPSAVSSDGPEGLTTPKSNPNTSRLTVELFRASDFDSSEYLSVQQTQSSPYSSQAVSELEAHDRKIALGSDTSQKTIPDSQGTAKSDIIGEPLGELVGEYTDTSAHSSSPAAHQDTIPDSQSQVYEPLTVNETADTHTPEPVRQDTTSSAPEEVIPDSTDVNADIPPRQPDQLDTPLDSVGHILPEERLRGSGEAHESERIPESEEVARRDEAPVREEVSVRDEGPQEEEILGREEGREEAPDSADQEPSQPVFITQPFFPEYKPISSSVQSELQAHHEPSPQLEPSSAREEVSQTSIPKELEPVFYDSPSPRLSQAAQLAKKDLEPFPDNLIESVDTEFERKFDCESQRVISRTTHEPEAKYTPPPPRSLPQYSPGILLAISRDSHDYTDDMSGRGPNEPTSSSRPSALAEVRALWDDEPTPQPADQNQSWESKPAPPTGLMPPPSSYHPEASEGSSRLGHVDFFSQPPLESRPWGNDGSSSVGQDTSRLAAPPGSATEMMRKLLDEGYAEPQSVQPATVSPADVSLPSEAERLTLPVLTSHEHANSGLYDSSGPSVTLAQLPLTDKDASPRSSESEEVDAVYMVTLPFQASIRSLYDEVLFRNRSDVTKFTEIFATEILAEPEPSLVNTIDNLFHQLRNLCDYPENVLEGPLRDLPIPQKVRYYLDANAKMNFLYEFLQAIAKDTRILVVARSSNLLRLVCDIAEALQLECVCEALGYSAPNPRSPVRLTLALLSQSNEIDARQYDVVVGYDGAFSDSAFFHQLSHENTDQKQKQPLVLRLITTFSIEHIESELPLTATELERKNALLIGLVNARPLLDDPPRLPQPPSVAKLFADYVNGEAQSIAWDPEPIPASVVDVYANSQSMSQMPRESSFDPETGGRKRKMDDDEDAESKRMRMHRPQGRGLGSEILPVSDAVQRLLEEVGFKEVHSSTASGERQLSMPVSVLEALAEKFSEASRIASSAKDVEPRYRSQISGLESQVKDFEKTQEGTYKRYRESIQDRTQFAADARKATFALQQSSETAKQSEEKSQQKIAELEAIIHRLTAESSGTANEKLLQDANAKIQLLEKRLETSHRNEDYIRKLYQEASGTASAVRAEFDEMKELNEELKKKASDNLRSIHEIQAKNSAKEYLRQIASLQTQVKDSQIELDRVRDELRQVKNGRRETRQVSVPRSPRMGSMMSPRARAPFAGPASRGASPAPPIGAFDTTTGPQFTTPQGNGRFSHLR